MPAAFANDLCGYRPSNGEANTSDNNDPLSRELGKALFEEMGVPAMQRVGTDPGGDMELAVQRDLQPRRHDLDVIRSRAITDFDQYRHLGVFRQFRRGYSPAAEILAKLKSQVERLPTTPDVARLLASFDASESSLRQQDELARQVMADMPEESFLKVDITIGQTLTDHPPLMQIGLSSKWSLRTDRAQDCISQGAKLASQRRGVMPHFGVLTMEPRPAMLKILADGSGAIDCIYHLDLPALQRAISRIRANKGPKWQPGITFDRLILQRRLRDYDELVRAVELIPPFHVYSGGSAQDDSTPAL